MFLSQFSLSTFAHARAATTNPESIALTFVISICEVFNCIHGSEYYVGESDVWVFPIKVLDNSMLFVEINFLEYFSLLVEFGLQLCHLLQNFVLHFLSLALWLL